MVDFFIALYLFVVIPLAFACLFGAFFSVPWFVAVLMGYVLTGFLELMVYWFI